MTDITNTTHGGQRTRPVFTGGLMRCCLATLDEATTLTETPGEVLHCLYCPSSMRLSPDGWRWARDLYPEEK